jgi:arginase
MTQHVRVVGVPFALGGSKHGPAQGPSRLKEYGLIEHIASLGYSTSYVDIQKEGINPDAFTIATKSAGGVHALSSVREVTTLAGAHTFAAHRVGHFPLILGGDHSVSIGTLPQFLDPTISPSKKVGLLWIDAHYDAHTPNTTHSHYANGLPLASVLGRGSRKLGCYRSEGGISRKKRLHFLPQYVLHVGAGRSDCEPEELALLTKLGVKTVTMQDIRRGGVDAFVRPLLRLLCGVDHLIVTIDLDAIHQDYAPGVSFRSKHGMIPEEALLIGDIVRESGKLRQLEIMEYNPDFEEYTMAGSPKTADFVFRLLEQLLRASK